MKYRNWIEAATGKRMAAQPVYIGSRGGRKEYAVTLEDGTEKDYYIDFEKEEIEAV